MQFADKLLLIWLISLVYNKIYHQTTVILSFSTAEMTSWPASGGILTTELRQQFVSADDYMLQSHLKNADWLSHGQRLERAFWLVIFINRIEYISSVLPHVSASLHDLDRASMKNTTSITSFTRFTEKTVTGITRRNSAFFILEKIWGEF